MKILITHRRRQRGATLIVSLLLLVIITIMGLAAIRTSTLEERMARYGVEQGVAFQAAEAALRDAEIDLTGSTSTRFGIVQGVTGFAADCNATAAAAARINGLCLPAPAGSAPVWQTQMGVAGAAVTYGTYGGNLPLPTTGGPSSVAQQPRYVVEGITTPGPGTSLKVGTVNARYRVTAQGFGPRQEVQAWVQTMVQP
ncbi:hypothetical protein GCM10025771_40600 [Niveibacterium umoris]|uniref:Type IV pilus assembly protein PilX n=1 Tax=Niveibacterium umoris TaxID=1193620 RepID=A0A840BJK6_9RHOO|nr:PilX N-terminal domain-containing pilus assembly protein [Niveibacterium umoris]MBB4010737.1 type IV pilus assembly protein PilX [Niveibacterium umoris]